jgi:hypothetical protein
MTENPLNFLITLTEIEYKKKTGKYSLLLHPTLRFFLHVKLQNN